MQFYFKIILATHENEYFVKFKVNVILRTHTKMQESK